MAKPTDAKIMPMPPEGKTAATPDYDYTQKEFVAAVRNALNDVKGEVGSRNTEISRRDEYIYGNLLENTLDIPIGHDNTPVNWLRRTVEIHKIQFMGRPFQVVSTYDTQDTSNIDDPEEKQRLELENRKKKSYAELRKNTIDDIIRDNGGHSLFMDGAESASAIGDWIVKGWYDDKAKRYVLSPIEAVENCYAVWDKDDFRSFQMFGYAFQVSKQKAMDDYGCPTDTPTSPMGSPLDYIGENVTSPTWSSQPMVTVLEVTGKLPGWGTSNGKIVKVAPGKENEFNALIVGNYVKRVIDDDKKLPRHYIFPNKKQRRRPWGASDVSDAAININATYIETLSDWRTVASKINFPKFRGFNFGPDVVLPKFEARRVQIVPLGEGQDIQPLQTGDANQQDFRAQMDELKEQFVRETGISRVLFDDPSITLNSNQALLTSMKPTSDIAESKKQLWGPILVQMFSDAIQVIGQYDDTVKELADTTDTWSLKLQWPSIMQKEDPVFQQMLLNRKNSGTISLQSYLEQQGETTEEIDRIREEMADPVTAAIHGNSLPLLAQQLIAPPPPPPEEKPRTSVNISSKDMKPQQVEMIAAEATKSTNDDKINETQQANAGEAQAGGQPVPGQPPAAIATPANNQEGQGVVSQPGSGATSTSPQGALDQTTQNQGG